MSKLKKEEQILELNNEVRCTLKPSPIQGIGVFALRSINQGERCYCTPNLIPKFYNIPFGSLNKLLPEIREIILARWASTRNGSVFQSPNDDQSLLMFVNHAPYPECNYDVVSDTALKDIPIGTELTEDYCAMANAEDVYPWLKCNKKEDNLWKSEPENRESSILKSIKEKLFR